MLRKLSKNQNLDLEIRIKYAKRASDLSYRTKVDSTIIKSNNGLIRNYLKKRDFNEVKTLSFKNLKLAQKIKDSFAIADAHYFIGEFYRYSNLGDSAFFYHSQAEKFYRHKKYKYKLVKTLYGISNIQRDEKDLIGSEITSIQVLSILEGLKQTNEIKKLRSFTYNNLGIVFSQLKQYDESIKYYKKSIEIKRELKGDFEYNINNSLNNLAYVYKISGQYDKAFKNNSEVLDNVLLIDRYSDLYVNALDNYAHTLFLSSNKNEQLPKLYIKALKVCDSVKDKYRSIIIHQHLAEYYDYKNQKDSALYHGYKAKVISEQFYKDDVLKSLLVLSKIEVDSIAVKHYEAYITLNDSIQKEERLKRNKYARIQFETDQHIKETKRLDKQNGLILTIASILVLVLGLLYFIKVQRSKNKELVYQSEQEKANQELYKLMLAQQTKLEEGRLYERHRIAEELHDGILSRLFGTRMGMGFLKVKGDTKTIDDFNLFINEMQGIEQDIRDVSHELKSEVLFSKSSFETIVGDYVKSQSNIGNFKYNITNNKVVFKVLSESIRLEVYRIIQESVQNIIKHAKAKHVSIAFTKKENTLEISIQDDGVGFNAKGKYKGIGLKNIASRVLKLEGDFTIDSTLKQGTEINITIPLNNA